MSKVLNIIFIISNMVINSNFNNIIIEFIYLIHVIIYIIKHVNIIEYGNNGCIFLRLFYIGIDYLLLDYFDMLCKFHLMDFYIWSMNLL